MKHLTAGVSRANVLAQCVVAGLIYWSTTSVNAVTNSSQFAVSATFMSTDIPTLPKSAFCQTTPALAFGALVTVVCATGEVVNVATPFGAVVGVPILGRAYQIVLSRTFSTGLPSLNESSSGNGLATSWRMIQVGDRSYYELLMGW